MYNYTGHTMAKKATRNDEDLVAAIDDRSNKLKLRQSTTYQGQLCTTMLQVKFQLVRNVALLLYVNG